MATKKATTKKQTSNSNSKRTPRVQRVQDRIDAFNAKGHKPKLTLKQESTDKPWIKFVVYQGKTVVVQNVVTMTVLRSIDRLEDRINNPKPAKPAKSTKPAPKKAAPEKAAPKKSTPKRATKKSAPKAAAAAA